MLFSVFVASRELDPALLAVSEPGLCVFSYFEVSLMSVTPPSSSVFPTGDADLAQWAGGFAGAWAPINFLVTAPTQEALVAAATEFDAALQANIWQRSADTVIAKNVARKKLTDLIRVAARAAISRYRADPAGNAAKVTLLGLRLPSLSGTPIGVPQYAPLLGVDKVTSGEVSLRLTHVMNGDAVNTRGFPPGIGSVQIEQAEGNGDYSVVGVFRRVNIRISTAGVSAGSVLLFRARYLNPKGQAGPASVSVSCAAF